MELLKEPTAAYAGYDPTADGLHVGSLVTLMALSHLQRAGHTPVILIGGATGLIGDPSGRDTERSLLSEKEATENCAKVGADALTVVLRASDPNGPKPVLVNNADWYSSMTAMTLLRDIGRHFRVPTMLKRESVARRMDSQEGISFTEFSYQLLQSHDFFQLHKGLNVCLQLGGSDQWGNITAGIEYAKRRGSTKRMAGITVPLISSKDGQKLGKSAGNAVWLSDRKTSHFDLYQYFVQTPSDDMVARWMGLMTLMPMDEIAKACAVGGGHAQRVLAREVVALLRGEEAAAQAIKDSEALYGSGGAEGLEASVVLSRQKLSSLTAVDIALQAGLVPSKAEARRLISQGGLYVNDTRIEDGANTLTLGADENSFIIRAGKRKRLLVKIE